MVVLYTSPGCASCRKVKKWLEDNELDYIEKNIVTLPLNEVELRHIISRSENGTEDIISNRSKVIRETNIDLESLSLSELIRFIQTNPTVLRRPIVVSERHFQVGYDDEEIEMFLPREKEKEIHQEVRRIVDEECNEDCPHYPYCGHWRNGDDLEEVSVEESR